MTPQNNRRDGISALPIIFIHVDIYPTTTTERNQRLLGSNSTRSLSAYIVEYDGTTNQLLSFLMCHRFYSLLSHETASQYYSAPRHRGHSSEAPARTDEQTLGEWIGSRPIAAARHMNTDT